MIYKNIFTKISGKIGVITVNRPQVMNALDIATVDELKNAVGEFDKEGSVRVLVITGGGEKSFVSGADIAAMLKMAPNDAMEFARHGHDLMNAIESCSKPVIAAVNGFALGGGTELAISCDMIIASENAKFGLPEVKLGLYPGFGGTQRLKRLIGEARAREMIFTGQIIPASRAYDIGIVNHVYAQADLTNETMKLAEQIAANSPNAIKAAKRVMKEGLELKGSDSLAFERDQFPHLFEHPDRTEGLQAFLDKRRPEF